MSNEKSSFPRHIDRRSFDNPPEFIFQVTSGQDAHDLVAIGQPWLFDHWKILICFGYDQGENKWSGIDFIVDLRSFV